MISKEGFKDAVKVDTNHVKEEKIETDSSKILKILRLKSTLKEATDRVNVEEGKA